MITGDASVNPGAPLICCTAEILAIDGLRYGSQARIDTIVMDEFHFYSDRERGVAWQIPLLPLRQSQFLFMSASLGDTEFFEKCLWELTSNESETVRTDGRPVPIHFEYKEVPLHVRIAQLMRENKAPVYVVHFTQREAAEGAQNFLSVDYCTKEEKKILLEALGGEKFKSPYGKRFKITKTRHRASPCGIAPALMPVDRTTGAAWAAQIDLRDRYAGRGC